MKTFLISLIIIGSAIYCKGQSADFHKVKPAFSPGISASAIQFCSKSPLGTGEPGDQPCTQYRRMKTAGIVLLSAGGGLVLISGGLLIGSFTASVTYPHGGPDNSLGLLLGSFFTDGIGLASIVAGIPLLVVGSVKLKSFVTMAAVLQDGLI